MASAKRGSAAISLEHMEGKYEILEKMREGGMGAVYKVRHQLLDEVRVIKVMRPHLAKDETLRARFVREAKTAIRLRHPNLAQLYDFTVDEEGTAFIVMEFIPGITLVDMSALLGSPDIGLALEISCQSLEVLGYLHRRGVIHRDISPDNLLLTRDDDGKPLVKLIDLGIAKVSKGDENLTTAGTFLGKVRYSSPEHFKTHEGAEINEQSDLYSLGIVIYELLTGKYPIMGNDTTSIMAGHLLNAPIAFKETDPEGRVPEEIRSAVLQALAKDPDQRFADAAAFRRLLQPFRKRCPVTEECLHQIFEAPEEATKRIKVVRPGSTQRRLDRHFGMETTPSHPSPAAGELSAVAKKQTELTPTAAPGKTASVSVEQQVGALLSGAGKLVELQHFEEATLQLTSVLELDPDNKRAQHLMAQVRAADKRLQARLTETAKEVSALLAAGELVDAAQRLDLVCEKLGTNDELDRLREQLTEAEQEHKERLAKKQQLVEAATAASSREDYSTAVGLLEQAIALDAGDRELRRQLKQAKQAHQQQLEERRRQQEIASTAAAIIASIERDELEDAKRAIEVAEKLYGSGEPFTGLRGKLEEAYDRRSEQQADELRTKAETLVGRRDYPAAIGLLEQALDLVPQHMKTMRALAAAKKALAEQEEERRQTRDLREGIDHLIAAGRLETARHRLSHFEADHGELQATAELRARIDEAQGRHQERRDQAMAILERARALVAEDDFDAARALLGEAAAHEQELLEVRDRIEEIGARIRQRAEELRTAKEMAKVAESIRQRLAQGALTDAERELKVAERLFGSHDVVRELRRQLDAAQRQLRMEQVEKLLRAAMTEQSSFAEVVSNLERALELDPENENVQRLLVEARSNQQRYQQEQRLRSINEAMREIDELIWAGKLAAARDRVEEAVKQLGEFKEARAVRFHLSATIGAPPPPLPVRPR